MLHLSGDTCLDLGKLNVARANRFYPPHNAHLKHDFVVKGRHYPLSCFFFTIGNYYSSSFNRKMVNDS